jgi:pyruvate/2-oxoglutarate dehydrogenase complex dihydrolipoamide acyltransferase (E2) component
MLQVSVKPGQKVEAGQVIAVMTAMKMETTVGCPCTGIVSHVAIIKGDTLAAGDLMVRVSPGDGTSDEGGAGEGQAEGNGAGEVQGQEASV